MSWAAAVEALLLCRRLAGAGPCRHAGPRAFTFTLTRIVEVVAVPAEEPAAIFNSDFLDRSAPAK